MINQDFIWVSKCIASCTNEWQLKSAYELIILFTQKQGKTNQAEILINQYKQKQNYLII